MKICCSLLGVISLFLVTAGAVPAASAQQAPTTKFPQEMLVDYVRVYAAQNATGQ